jgi:hypothetical protein
MMRQRGVRHAKATLDLPHGHAAAPGPHEFANDFEAGWIAQLAHQTCGGVVVQVHKQPISSRQKLVNYISKNLEI